MTKQVVIPVYNVADDSLVQAEHVRIKCDQCQACMINGVFCHETGCPNSGSRYDIESLTWIKQRECFTCGYTVDADNPCCDDDEA